MERLSALDAEFLHIEDDVAHMHIGGVSVFEGPTPRAADVVDLVRRKLHLIPRYRKRVGLVPLELGRPVWEDDPHFDLERHVRFVTASAPGDDAVLRRLVGALMSDPLDREHPLWETWLVDGLAGRRWALVTKIHHCMVDGVAGVELLTVLLGVEREAAVPDAVPWAPSPAASGPAKVLDAWRGLAGDVAARAGRVPGALRHPTRVLEAARGTVGGLVRFGRDLPATPPLSIEGTIGPNRAWAHSSVSLDDVRAIRARLGGTVNDVVLAAVAGGYRELLLRRGDDVDAAVLRCLVPMSTRGGDGQGLLDNRVAALVCELPVHVADPRERLRVVRDEMSEVKSSHMAEASVAVTSAGNLAPPFVVGVASRLGMRVLRRLPQRSVNTVATNVPGPQIPLFCLGREMLAYYPFAPITHGVRVSTAILSYNGSLAFGVTGDLDTAPDVDVAARAIAACVTELRDLAA